MTAGRATRFLAAILAALGCAPALGDLAEAPADTGMPTVAIIIDDLGYRRSEGLRTLALPPQVTVAILPQTPFGRQFARDAHARGMQVMLHLPLQATDAAEDPGPGGISLDTDSSGLSRLLAQGLDDVPYAAGVNNHMGSLLTRHPGHMNWLMEELRGRGLFFVDSYTTPHSVALQMARESGVPSLRRNVFLDRDPAPGAVEAQFEQLLKLARERGHAVAIGHPYPSTLDLLEKRLPDLAGQGIRLVTAGEMVDALQGRER